MPRRTTAAAWMLCAAISSTTGATAAAQAIERPPIASRRLVQSYTDAVDASFTRLAAPWSLGNAPSTLPCRVLAHAQLQPLLLQLWSRSATFRQQCRRLAGAQALVLLQRASAKETVWNAESRIGVLDNGHVLARVRVRTGRESVEIIAHEFEHVLERIDGVQLALDAMRPGSGTTLAGGAYETRRATEAGRRAAKEVRRTSPPRRLSS
jgi:hypothetical protein